MQIYDIIYTSASLHDSQVMIPLVKKTTERMAHGFDLADAAYDAETIREASVEEGNVPVIDANSRRGEQRHMTDTERDVYRDRGTDERFFSHLLDAHGGRHVRVRAPKKVLQHLLYGGRLLVLRCSVGRGLRPRRVHKPSPP